MTLTLAHLMSSTCFLSALSGFFRIPTPTLPLATSLEATPSTCTLVEGDLSFFVSKSLMSTGEIMVTTDNRWESSLPVHRYVIRVCIHILFVRIILFMYDISIPSLMHTSRDSLQMFLGTYLCLAALQLPAAEVPGPGVALDHRFHLLGLSRSNQRMASEIRYKGGATAITWADLVA